VVDFLRECDLVKFANVVPTPDECARALDAGERIVRATTPQMPLNRVAAPAPQDPGGPPSAAGATP